MPKRKKIKVHVTNGLTKKSTYVWAKPVKVKCKAADIPRSHVKGEPLFLEISRQQWKRATKAMCKKGKSCSMYTIFETETGQAYDDTDGRRYKDYSDPTVELAAYNPDVASDGYLCPSPKLTQEAKRASKRNRS
jgi:hypothetical protein